LAGRLTGKTILVTGAASGMGKTETNLFLEEGAEVIATDYNVEQLQKEFSNYPSTLTLHKLDVSSEEDWINVVEQFDRIDGLVNNAGIYIQHSFEEFSINLWNRMMDINALGTMLGMQYVIPKMKPFKKGSIVNIASVDANIGTGNSYIYTASKGAVRSLTKKMAIEFAIDNIRINSIHPGLIHTPMTDAQIKSEKGSYAQFHTPLKFIGEPLDIAYGALYLLSDESRYMTGAELVIDGGLLAI